MTPLDQAPLLRRDDEVCVFQGASGDETVRLFVSSATDRTDHWRVRAVFADREGFVTDERLIDHPRKGPLRLTLMRLGKPDFNYSAKPLKGSALANTR